VDFKTKQSEILKHEHPRAWSLTDLDNASTIHGHTQRVIMGLSKSLINNKIKKNKFSKCHNPEQVWNI